MESTLRSLRQAADLTQAELAAQAGVSRQLVGAVEAGRHLPRVDAALALASVLGVDVGRLFGADPVPADAISGAVPVSGSLVRAGRVGDSVVTAPVRMGPDGWDVADAAVEDGTIVAFSRHAPGLVTAGCEPGLEVLERILREGGMAAVAATSSSTASLAALAGGRLHAAVVHGPAAGRFRSPKGLKVDRFRLARWRVGLAAPADAPADWSAVALSGKVPVVQREQGAGVQRTFQEIAGDAVPGPRVATHLEAGRRAVLTGMPAVTIEPAALAVGAVFHPLDVHEAQMWVAHQWLAEREVGEALNVIAGRRFQRRLMAVGGYDLTGCGTRIA